MADVSKPAGLSPVKYLNGANWDGKVQIYTILAANTNAFFPGDLVTPQANGDAGGLPAITLAAAGAVACGVIVAVGTSKYGPYINPNDLSKLSRPSGSQSVNYYAAVVDDPNVIFEIQEGGAGTNLTQTSCNRNANIVTGTPATGVNLSATVIDNATAAATSTLNLRLLRLAPRADNVFVSGSGGGAQKWWVLINNHSFRAGSTAL